jgi:DNA-3-methyladenine glycosylase
LRALEALEGINLMDQYRKTGKLMDLARGAGAACHRIANRPIGRQLDGIDLCADGPLRLGTAAREPARPAACCVN